MKFTQKKFAFTRASFEFGERKLDYVFKDENGVSGFSIGYENIGSEKSHRTLGELWIDFFFGMSLIYTILDYKIISNGRGMPDWITIGMIIFTLLLGLLGKFKFKGEATVIGTSLGNIIVLSDDQSSQIIAEIFKRRKDALRRMLGTMNPLNYPQDEINKFRWLRDEEIITPTEFNTAFVEITSLQHKGDS